MSITYYLHIKLDNNVIYVTLFIIFIINTRIFSQMARSLSPRNIYFQTQRT